LILLRPLMKANAPLALKAICESTGFSPPKAHRYLVSLARSGLVVHEANGRYSLGQFALELGLAAIGLFDPGAVGRTAIADLAAINDTTSCLVVWANSGPTVAAVSPAPSATYMTIRIGTTLPLLRSASGNVFLAFANRDQIQRHLDHELTNSPIEPAIMDAMLSKVRREGMARAKDTVAPGMSGIAIPVFDHEQRVVYVLAAVGPTAVLDLSRQGQLAKSFLNKAAEIGEQLGSGILRSPR